MPWLSKGSKEKNYVILVCKIITIKFKTYVIGRYTFYRWGVSQFCCPLSQPQKTSKHTLNSPPSPTHPPTPHTSAPLQPCTTYCTPHHQTPINPHPIPYTPTPHSSHPTPHAHPLCFIEHPSPLITHTSLLTFHHAPLSLTHHHSSLNLITHPSPLAIYHSPPHYSPLITHPSSPTLQHLPPITHPLSLSSHHSLLFTHPHHSTLFTHSSSYIAFSKENVHFVLNVKFSSFWENIL